MNKQNFEFELKEFNRIKKGLEEGERMARIYEAGY